MAILDKHVERGRRANELGQQRRYYPSIYIVLFFSPFYFFFFNDSAFYCGLSSFLVISPQPILWRKFLRWRNISNSLPSDSKKIILLLFPQSISFGLVTIQPPMNMKYGRLLIFFFFFLFTCPSTQPSLRKKATISLVLCMMIPTIFSSFASYSFSKGFWKRKKKKKVNKFERTNKKPQQPTWWHGHIPVAFLPLCVHLPRFRAQTLVTTCCSNCCCCCCCCRVECRQRRAVRGFARCQTAMSRKSSQPHP